MQYYGHRNIIRKTTAAFMGLFDDMYIEKYRSNGTTSLFRVPIQFANREKWMQHIQSQVHFAGNHDGYHNNTRLELDMIFPRISVNIMSMDYDTVRKVSKTNQILACESCTLNELSEKAIFAPAPWNIEYEMAVISKNMDDGLQIIEQIMPFFQPSLSINVNYLEGFKSNSIPIILESVTPTHDEDLDADIERNFIWLLNFRIKVNFYPPRMLKGRIEDVIMNVHPNEKNSSHDLFTQYQLNAKKLENINNLDGFVALKYDREQELVTLIPWGDEDFETFKQTFKDTEYEISLVRSDGEFEYDSNEFYMTDLAGTTTYKVECDYNLISYKTTTLAEAIGSPQAVYFKEKTSQKDMVMSITAAGVLQVNIV